MAHRMRNARRRRMPTAGFSALGNSRDVANTVLVRADPYSAGCLSDCASQSAGSCIWNYRRCIWIDSCASRLGAVFVVLLVSRRRYPWLSWAGAISDSRSSRIPACCQSRADSKRASRVGHPAKHCGGGHQCCRLVRLLWAAWACGRLLQAPEAR